MGVGPDPRFFHPYALPVLPYEFESPIHFTPPIIDRLPGSRRLRESDDRVRPLPLTSAVIATRDFGELS